MHKPTAKGLWGFVRSVVLCLGVTILVFHYLFPGTPMIDGRPLTEMEAEMVRARRAYAGYKANQPLFSLEEKAKLMADNPPRFGESASEYEKRLGLIRERDDHP